MIKKITFSVFACFTAFIFLDAINKTSGGHPSSTGAPDEKTCAQTNCHSDASITKDSPFNKFTFSDINDTYKADGIYTASIEVNVANIQKFGFMVVAIDSATKQNAGKWILTESTKTHIIIGEAPFTTRSYITHTAAGTTPISSGKGKWNFKWQAPNANKGTIIFYYTTNATNKNDASNGDQLFLSSHKIRYSANSVKIIEAPKVKPMLKLANNSVMVVSDFETVKSIKLFNLEGKLLYHNEKLNHGDCIDLEPLSKTLMIYQLTTDKGIYIGKLLL
jgi:hypothetical protein